ncbi:MAG: DUF1385 domain-containing protein [Christensenellales bacterium]
MKPSGIGGQAVLEGVMMKNRDRYAVAVRKPDGEIEVEKGHCQSLRDKYFVCDLPIIRGVVTFVESLVLGMKSLTDSSKYYEDEEEENRQQMDDAAKERHEKIETTFTVILSIVIAVGIFMVLPFFISELLKSIIKSAKVLAVIEGIIRIIMFIGYVFAISFVEDIKRVFMYHGAEHKTINCVEHMLPLTVENVRKQSREHKRCGTSFIFIVLFISIIFFIFIRVDNMWLKVLYRIVLVPVIAGVSYEFIRLAGKSENALVNILSKPGMMLQKLTTKEPDDSMIEVAIASVEAVFDWKKFQEDSK